MFASRCSTDRPGWPPGPCWRRRERVPAPDRRDRTHVRLAQVLVSLSGAGALDSNRIAGTGSVTVPSPRGNRSRIRVVVLADRFLIGDAVRMALEGRGFSVLGLRTPTGPEEVRRADHDVRRFRPSVGVLLTEVEDPVRLRDAAVVVSRVPARWVLLTGSASEASWGAVLSAGAVGVLPMSVSLDDLSHALASVTAGRPVMADETRARAVRAWEEVSEEQTRLVRQMEQLTPRELAVLGLLYNGLSVRSIAEEAGVSEGTVRSQVKAILRKLQVNSQLAAVAAYRQVSEQANRKRRQQP